MKTGILMRKILNGLAPDNEVAQEAIRRIAVGDVVKIEIKRPRSLPWHRRYWALVSLVANNSSYTPEEAHELIKIRCGCTKIIKERNGNVIVLPDSIAFDRMDGIAWSQFWDRVVDYCAAELLNGISSEALRMELGEIVGVRV